MFDREIRLLAAVVSPALVGLLAVAASIALASCAASPGAIHAAYCSGVSEGGRAALAELATGRPVPVIACAPSVVAPTSSATPAPVVVIIRPGDLVAPSSRPAPPAPVPTLAEPVDPLV